MAAGEKRWSSKGRQVVRYNFTPVPAQDWDAKILGETVEIKKKQEPGTFPYINIAFECLDSAAEEGQKNRRIYHMFFVKLTPGKDGVVSADRSGGITEFARAMGQETPEFKIVTQQDVEGVVHELLSPQEVMRWVKSMDGAIVKLHSKIRRQKDRDPQAVVDFFIASEGTESLEAVNEETETEETSEQTYEEMAEDNQAKETMESSEPEAEEEEEQTPPARPARSNGVAKHAVTRRAPPPPAKGKARPATRR